LRNQFEQSWATDPIADDLAVQLPKRELAEALNRFEALP
jgi:hypothetical protein